MRSKWVIHFERKAEGIQDVSIFCLYILLLVFTQTFHHENIKSCKIQLN